MVNVFLSASHESDMRLRLVICLYGSLFFEHRGKGQGNVFATLLMGLWGTADEDVGRADVGRVRRADVGRAEDREIEMLIQNWAISFELNSIRMKTSSCGGNGICLSVITRHRLPRNSSTRLIHFIT